MSCVLRAVGVEFDVEAFLGGSPFRAYAVYGKHDAAPAAASSGRARTPSGFGLAVSDAEPEDLRGQIRDAILFLDYHEDELRRLGSFPGVEIIALDFGVRFKDGAGQTDSFPSELLWRAGALDITLQVSHYPITQKES